MGKVVGPSLPRNASGIQKLLIPPGPGDLTGIRSSPGKPGPPLTTPLLFVGPKILGGETPQIHISNPIHVYTPSEAPPPPPLLPRWRKETESLSPPKKPPNLTPSPALPPPPPPPPFLFPLLSPPPHHAHTSENRFIRFALRFKALRPPSSPQPRSNETKAGHRPYMPSADPRH